MHHVTAEALSFASNMDQQKSGMSRALSFVGSHAIVIAILSAIMLVPCFWQRHIEAGDLASHTYNAWLAQLIQQGKAPGLYTVWRWDNVLFDLILFYSTKIFGFGLGPKLAVAVCVLTFFWGVFSLTAAASGRVPWLLTPCIAMLAYGYVFNMGFFNYYLSIGLACWGLAALWRPQPRDWLAGAVVLQLTVLAHPIGALWFTSTCAYVVVRRKFKGIAGFIVPAAAIAAFGLAHFYFARFSQLEINWRQEPFYWFTGADQLVVYSVRYRWIAGATLLIFLLWFVFQCFHWRRQLTFWKPLAFAAELYVVSFCVVSLVPEDVRLGLYSAWIGLLVYRLTVICAVFALCAASCLKPSWWTAVPFSSCAIIFFWLLHGDTGILNRMEGHAETITATLPFGTRVVPTLVAPAGSRIPFLQHIVDRACIGHCFTYSNYEASSRQFRVRVAPGSPIVTSSAGDSQEMEAGNYVVQASDPPMINIYQCDPADFTVLCARSLKIGEPTGQQPDATDE